jgi:hypothetical protein
MDYFTKFILAFIIIFFTIMIGLHVPVVMFILLIIIAVSLISYALEVLENL